jgi:transcriptional regulator with XRE-family HTH domain
MIGFGKRLAAFRKEKGLSQQELADMMETSKTTVTNWETGRFKPTWDMLEKIASVLDVSLAMLVDEEKQLDLSTVSTEELLREIHKRII